MFSFLNPLFLWAAAAAAIPLVLHLMQRQRTVRLPFSTIRFLKLAQKRSSSRIRMENFLLWLLRTALMTLLSLGFAMPMLRTKAFGNFLSRSSRDIAIVLDGSFSMDYSLGKDTVWNKAVQAAISVVESLEEGDRLCIFMATDDVKPVIEQLSEDKVFAVTTLKSADSVTTPSQLAPAVLAAWNALKQEERRREREIHIITDGQAFPWQGFKQTDTNKAPAAARATPAPTNTAAARTPAAPSTNAAAAKESGRLDLWQPEKIDEKTAFFITCLGVPNPENVAPVDVEVQPSLIISDMASKVMTRMTYSGAPRSTSAKLLVDDEEIASRAVSLGTEGADDVTFSVPPLKSGRHAARIETPQDNLSVDNKFHFIIEVRESLPVLCVATPDDALFLMKALNPGGANPSGIKVKQVNAEDLPGEDLTRYSTVILCNALPLSGQEVMRLEQFVSAGGLLALFPGNRAVIGDYKPWSCLPGMPSRIAESERSQTKRLLRWAKPQHPLLRTLRLGPEGAPVVTIRRELQWDALDPKAETLIMSGAETRFLVSRAFGKGQVLMCSLSADRTWGEFPLSPFFLPILHHIVQYGAGLGGFTPYLWATRSLSLSEQLPFATESDALSDPDGGNVPIRSSNAGSKTLLRVENLLRPGVYMISEADSTEKSAAFAINIDRRESDLSPVKREEIPALIGRPNVVVAGDRDELMRLVKEHRVGRTLGEVILWIALILSILECAYANYKMKSIRPLSETLGVEASGKIPITSPIAAAGEPESGGEA